jgi:hypothetical protein
VRGHKIEVFGRGVCWLTGTGIGFCWVVAVLYAGFWCPRCERAFDCGFADSLKERSEDAVSRSAVA